MSNRQTDKQIIEQINGCLDRAHTATVNSDIWQAKAGEQLIKLKKQAGHGNWLKYLKSDIGISKRRASELMRVGENIEALYAERERIKLASRKRRAKKKAKRAVRTAPLDYATGCNFNAEDPRHVALAIADDGKHDTDEEIRRRIFLHRAAEALRHAKENGFDKADDSEIDKEIISAARTAAEAWTDLYQQLLARQAAGSGKTNVVKIKKAFAS